MSQQELQEQQPTDEMTRRITKWTKGLWLIAFPPLLAWGIIAGLRSDQITGFGNLVSIIVMVGIGVYVGCAVISTVVLHTHETYAKTKDPKQSAARFWLILGLLYAVTAFHYEPDLRAKGLIYSAESMLGFGLVFVPFAMLSEWVISLSLAKHWADLNRGIKLGVFVISMIVVCGWIGWNLDSMIHKLFSLL